jgi:hypothetical protein
MRPLVSARAPPIAVARTPGLAQGGAAKRFLRKG